MDGIADIIEADLSRPGPTSGQLKYGVPCKKLKMGPIISTQIPLRRSYTFKEHLRLYFNLNRIKVCAFGAIKKNVRAFGAKIPTFSLRPLGSLFGGSLFRRRAAESIRSLTLK